MQKYLINFLEAKSILNPEQFAFRRGLSTFDALRTLTEKITLLWIHNVLY